MKLAVYFLLTIFAFSASASESRVCQPLIKVNQYDPANACLIYVKPIEGEEYISSVIFFDSEEKIIEIVDLKQTGKDLSSPGHAQVGTIHMYSGNGGLFSVRINTFGPVFVTFIMFKTLIDNRQIHFDNPQKPKKPSGSICTSDRGCRR
jgi:hypothetical protein